ncbi:hypothetical protein, partial [uncultured Oscillibacter sp.]|uniref:hypothetical protein n=1 Tax=uncultured Oscillibacter sp. TaxID=876091 RepID=UPI0026338D96
SYFLFYLFESNFAKLISVFRGCPFPHFIRRRGAGYTPDFYRGPCVKSPARPFPVPHETPLEIRVY